MKEAAREFHEIGLVDMLGQSCKVARELSF
jgi:hypothetical protein